MSCFRNSIFLLVLAGSLYGQTKISELTALATAPGSSDLLVVVDVGAPNVTKKVTIANFLDGLPAIDAASYELNGSGAIIHPPSAGEPVDCTVSNEGSLYFNTTDQEYCVCEAVTTVDEWRRIKNSATICS